MTLVAGVDSSTQSCKVLICRADDGTVVREGAAAHPDGTEIDPGHWETALRSAIAEAGGLDDVAALSVAGQQHGMVALDDAGEVIRPALLWNDTRSAAAAEDLIAEVGADELVSRTGSVPVASFTSTKLRWLRDHEPESAARVHTVALPHDWLTWRLAGGDLTTVATDRSDASGTGYFDPATDRWDTDLLELALGRPAHTPTLLGPAASAGHHGQVLLGAGAGDNAGGALGLNAGPGDVVVSLGTSGTISAVSTGPSHDPTGIVAGFADASGAFLPLVCTLNAARVLSVIGGLLGVDHEELTRLALAAEPGAGGVSLLPYFEGERTPNLPNATASLSGLTLASTTRENLARAAFEGMFGSLVLGLEAIRNQGGQPRRILLIGGAARNPAAAIIAEDLFGLPVDVPAPGQYVARGAARQAAWALSGELPDWPIEV